MSDLAIFGGEPVRHNPFPERITIGPQEIDAALDVLKSGHLSQFVGAPGNFFNGGTYVRRFEQSWADLYGFKYAVSTNSWTTGLQAAFGAIGIQPGDEVICPPTTMSATATSVLFYGGIPVFADIDPQRFTISPQSIESCITPRTKAIAVVHLFGYPADMNSILDVAKKHSLLVIEDAAQSPGIYYKGQAVGSIGDIGGFSLNYHKHIQSGEGGLIVTHNRSLAEKCQLIRNHGENNPSHSHIPDLANHIGSNYRFTELQAAIAIPQLFKLNNILQHRQVLASQLNKFINKLPGLSCQIVDDDCGHAYYMYPIIYNQDFFKISREVFVRAVNAELPVSNSWDTTPLASGYVKPIYLSPLYQKKIALGSSGFPFNYLPNVDYNYPEGLCPVAEQLYSSSLIISPLVRDPLTSIDIDDFIAAISKVYDNLHLLRDRQHQISDSLFTPIDAINDSSI